MRSDFQLSRNTIYVLSAVAVLAGCKDRNAPATTTAPDTAVVATEMTPRDSLGRPMGKVIRPALLNGVATKAGKVTIVAMELVQPNADFPGAFSTYKTQDMQMAFARIGNVGTMTLTPMFAGSTDPNAFIQIQFDTVKAAATDPAGAALTAATQGLKVSKAEITDAPYPWADAAKSYRYSVNGTPVAGVMIVGHRGPQTFHIMAQSPQNKTLEMAQRLELVLKHWRWNDYTYLVPSGLKAVETVKPADSVTPAPAPAPKKK